MFERVRAKGTTGAAGVADVAGGFGDGADHVVAQAQVVGDHRSHRGDAGDIDLRQLLDPSKDAVEFGHHGGDFRLGHLDAR